MYVAGAGIQTIAGQTSHDNANQEEADRVHRETGRRVLPHPDRILKRIGRNLNPTALNI